MAANSGYKKLHRPLHILVPNGDFIWWPHTFNLLIFQIINKQLVLFIYSAVLGDTSEPQQSWITLIKLGLTGAHTHTHTRTHTQKRHLETIVRLRGSKFLYKSTLNQHFGSAGTDGNAEAAITGQTAISQLGILRPIIERKLAYPREACYGNYVSKSQPIHLSQHFSPGEYINRSNVDRRWLRLDLCLPL